MILSCAGNPTKRTLMATYNVTVWKVGSNVRVSKWEELAPNKNIFYGCSLSGQSSREVLEESGRVFAHANITQAQIEDAFSIAKREGILRVVMEFRNELRYEITDQSLVNFIGDCWDLFQLVLDKLLIVWRRIRGPNNQEMKWLELIKGRMEADTIQNRAYQQRHSLKKSKKKRLVVSAKKEIGVRERKIQKFITKLKKRHTDTINKYRFPTDRILEIVAPKFLQKSDLRSSHRRIGP
jgi:hypothetical protein